MNNNQSFQNISQQNNQSSLNNNTYFEFSLNNMKYKRTLKQQEEFEKAQKKLNLNLGNYLYEYQKQKLYESWINSDQIQQLPKERKDKKAGKYQQNESFNKQPSIKNLKRQMSKSATYPQYIEQINGIYEGDLDMNYKKEGLGIFIEDQGEMYIGEWSNDQMHGEGILHFRFGGYLYGKFKQNKVHGIAILNIPLKNQLFIGYWKQSMLNGVCFELNLNTKQWSLSIYENGELKIKQQTESLEMNSTGMVYPKIMDPYEEIKFWMSRQSNKQYFLERLINTQQKHIKYVNIDKGMDYIGFVEENNIPEGLGLVKCDKGFIYGQFCNGILEGYGRMVLDNGDIYDGFYRKGQLNGQGYYFNFEKRVFMHAIFEDNIPKIYQTENQYRADLIKKERSEHHKSHRKFYAKEQHLEKLVFKILKNYEDFYGRGQLKFDGDINNMFLQSRINNSFSTRNFMDNNISQNVQFTQITSPTSQRSLDLTPEKQPEIQQPQQLPQNSQTTQQQNVNQSVNQVTIQNQQNNPNNKIINNQIQQATNQLSQSQVNQTQNQQKLTTQNNSNVIQGNQNNNNNNNQNVMLNTQNNPGASIQNQQTLPQQQIQQQQQQNQQQQQQQLNLQQLQLQNPQLQQFSVQQQQQQNQLQQQGLTQIDSSKQLSQQSFAENIVDSPVKMDNKNDVKNNLLTGGVIQGTRQTVKSQKRDSRLIEPPNIKKPIDLQYNASQEQYDNFQKLQETKKQYTANHEYQNETEFQMELDPYTDQVQFKKMRQSYMERSQRRKIFEDNPRYQKEKFQQSRSMTPHKELLRDDSSRSTLSQQKYRKNNYMQEINAQQRNRSQQNMQKGIVITHNEEKKVWESDLIGNKEENVDNNAEHFCIAIRDQQKNDKRQFNIEKSQQNDGINQPEQKLKYKKIFQVGSPQKQKFVDENFEQGQIQQKYANENGIDLKFSYRNILNQRTIDLKLQQKLTQNKENAQKNEETEQDNNNSGQKGQFDINNKETQKYLKDYVNSLFQKYNEDQQYSKVKPIKHQNFEDTRKESKYFKNEYRLKDQETIIKSNNTPIKDKNKKKIFDPFQQAEHQQNIETNNQQQILSVKRDENLSYMEGPNLSQGLQSSLMDVQNFKKNNLQNRSMYNQSPNSYRNQFENNSQYQATNRTDYLQSSQQSTFYPYQQSQQNYQISYNMSPQTNRDYQ
ncbi:hypothetical protein ABPG73_016192 [Tetrahymena malaccensis]